MKHQKAIVVVALVGLFAVGCVTIQEYDTERHLLSFREAERSVVMVLLPDTFSEDRVDTNGVEDNIESRSVPIHWPHAFEARLARTILEGWHERAPRLRLHAAAPAGEYMAERGLANCLAERDRIEKPWHNMETTSGLRYLDEPTKPGVAKKGMPRQVEPDTATLFSSEPWGNDTRSVCRTLDLHRVRRNFDVDYAVVVEVASIRAIPDDGRTRTRVVIYVRLIALDNAQVVTERRFEVGDNEPGGLLGAKLLAVKNAGELASESENNPLFGALDTLADRLPWLLAREFSDMGEAAVAGQKIVWERAFAEEVERLRGEVTVNPH